MHYCQRAIMTSDELGWFAVSDIKMKHQRRQLMANLSKTAHTA